MKEKMKKAEKTQEAVDLERAMRNEQRLVAEINKLVHLSKYSRG